MKLSNVGQHLRDAREQLGLSLDQASEMTGIKKTSLWRLETGDSTVSVERFFQIAEIYGVDPVALLSGRVQSGMTDADYRNLTKVIMLVETIISEAAERPAPERVASATVEVLRVETLRAAEQPGTRFDADRYEAMVRAVLGRSGAP